MNSPTGRPEFFILEAGEYLERLALLAKSSSPDPESLLRFARALRASALMAGPPGYAVAAGAIEELTREWNPNLAERLRGAVAECQDLLPRVRYWSAPEIERCRRIAEDLAQEEFEASVVPVEALAPDTDIVPIESLAPGPDAAVVPIESLAPETDIDVVPIESLLYHEPRAQVLAPAEYTPFEQSFSTYFRLLHSLPVEAEAIPIQRLLYRGRRALERAGLVQQELAAARRISSDHEGIEALLGELLDLVPLALEHNA